MINLEETAKAYNCQECKNKGKCSWKYSSFNPDSMHEMEIAGNKVAMYEGSEEIEAFRIPKVEKWKITYRYWNKRYRKEWEKHLEKCCEGTGRKDLLSPVKKNIRGGSYPRPFTPILSGDLILPDPIEVCGFDGVVHNTPLIATDEYVGVDESK